MLCVRMHVCARARVCVYWVGGVGRLEGDICCAAANVEKTGSVHKVTKQQAGNKQKPLYSSRATQTPASLGRGLFTQKKGDRGSWETVPA